MPNYDQDRVYVSDMKKIFGWYNFLKDNNELDLSDELEEEKENKVEAKKEKQTAKKDVTKQAKAAPNIPAKKSTAAVKK